MSIKYVELVNVMRATCAGQTIDVDPYEVGESGWSSSQNFVILRKKLLCEFLGFLGEKGFRGDGSESMVPFLSLSEYLCAQ